MTVVTPYVSITRALRCNSVGECVADDYAKGVKEDGSVVTGCTKTHRSGNRRL